MAKWDTILQSFVHRTQNHSLEQEKWKKQKEKHKAKQTLKVEVEDLIGVLKASSIILIHNSEQLE